MKTVAIIGSMGIPAKYGGFETLAEELSGYLTSTFNIIVACSKKSYDKTDRSKNYKKAKRFFIPFKPNGVSSILYDFTSILKLAGKADILLILGSSAAFTLPIFKLIYKKIIIVYHPDGLEWKRNKWNSFAKIFLNTSSRIGSFFSSSIIIDNEALVPYYIKYRDKFSIISYGGDQFEINVQTGQKNYWLTIARAEPENNLTTIASCFSELKNENWVLISNFNHSKYGKKLHGEFSKYKNIQLIESQYSKRNLSLYLSQCKGYIHGHSTGGTNPSLVSALWCKKPVICHDNSFNRATTHNLALFFNDKAGLNQFIRTFQKQGQYNTDQLIRLAEKEYKWEKIANEYTDLFQRLLNLKLS